MEARDLEYIAKVCAGNRLKGSLTLPIRRVCTDSRQAGPGDLFVALSGERFDGHDFIGEAARKGVSAVLVNREKVPGTLPSCATVAVEHTRQALGRLAAAYRDDFDIPIIAVCGSNGKTTTKDLIASVLRRKLNVLSSDASFNNDIGVPLTLLRLERGHQAAVLEAGTNHPGELAPLVRMIRPQYGVMTTLGREHLEFFGDMDGVAREEGWLSELLPPGGKLFINGDGEWAEGLIRRTRASAVLVGLGPQNDWRAIDIRLDKSGTVFRVETSRPEYRGEYRMGLTGRHQAVNALFAIAAGTELGLSRDEIERGLAECPSPRMRLQLWEHNGIRVLDDSYNANADSMLAALQTLQELPCKGRRIAALGDMAELGPHTEAAHEEVGRRAAELGVGQLFAVGKMAAATSRGARTAGLNRVLEFADVESAGSAIRSFVKTGDLLLLKASRACRFERIGDLLKSG